MPVFCDIIKKSVNVFNICESYRMYLANYIYALISRTKGDKNEKGDGGFWNQTRGNKNVSGNK